MNCPECNSSNFNAIGKCNIVDSNPSIPDVENDVCLCDDCLLIISMPSKKYCHRAVKQANGIVVAGQGYLKTLY